MHRAASKKRLISPPKERGTSLGGGTLYLEIFWLHGWSWCRCHCFEFRSVFKLIVVTDFRLLLCHDRLSQQLLSSCSFDAVVGVMTVGVNHWGGTSSPESGVGTLIQIVPGFSKIPLRIHQNTPFHAPPYTSRPVDSTVRPEPSLLDLAACSFLSEFNSDPRLWSRRRHEVCCRCR